MVGSYRVQNFKRLSGPDWMVRKLEGRFWPWSLIRTRIGNPFKKKKSICQRHFKESHDRRKEISTTLETRTS